MRRLCQAVDVNGDTREQIAASCRIPSVVPKLLPELLVLELHVLPKASIVVHRLGVFRLRWLLERQEMAASWVRHDPYAQNSRRLFNRDADALQP